MIKNKLHPCVIFFETFLCRTIISYKHFLSVTFFYHSAVMNLLDANIYIIGALLSLFSYFILLQLTQLKTLAARFVILCFARLGIRDFIVNLLIKLSKEESSLRSQKVLIHKLNHTLVQVFINGAIFNLYFIFHFWQYKMLKQDWPQNWPNMVMQ